LNIKVLLPFKREKAEKMEKSEKEMVGMSSFIGGRYTMGQKEESREIRIDTHLYYYFYT